MINAVYMAREIVSAFPALSPRDSEVLVDRIAVAIRDAVQADRVESNAVMASAVKEERYECARFAENAIGDLIRTRGNR